MSSKCPFCSKEVPDQIFIDGGHCPHCEELILGEWDDNEVTELFVLDEVTEHLDVTQPLPEDELVSEQTEDQESEEDFGIADPPKPIPNKPTVVNIDAPLNSLGSIHGYVVDEESSEELLDLPSREELGLSPEPKDEKIDSEKGSKSLGIVLALVAIIVVGGAAASSLGLFEEEEKPVISYENKTFDHLATNDVVVEEAKVVQKKTTEKVVKKKSSKPKVEEITVGGITTFKSSGPTLSRTIGGSSSKKTSSEKLQKDIGDLQRSLQYCHTRALKKDPTVRGKWEVSFTIQTTGKANKVKVKPLREKHSEMESCMKSRIERFSFSKPKSSSFQKFRMTFG